MPVPIGMIHLETSVDIALPITMPLSRDVFSCTGRVSENRHGGSPPVDSSHTLSQATLVWETWMAMAINITMLTYSGTMHTLSDRPPYRLNFADGVQLSSSLTGTGRLTE